MLSTYRREVLQNQLGRFRLPCAGFTTDDNALVLLVPAHMRVRIVTYREDVRRQLANLPLLVQFDLVRRIDW